MAPNFQQKDPVVLQRVLVIVLLVVSGILVTVYSHEDERGLLHGMQNVVAGITTPFKAAGAAASFALDSAQDVIDNVGADESTLSDLRAYNAELVEQYVRMEEYRQENERLRALLDLKDAAYLEGVGARIIGNSSQAWDQTVTINKGAKDGVDIGYSVMAASGVIGQVVSTTAHSAVVRLLTDPQSGAAALVQSSRAEGVVRGSLEGILYLENLDTSATVNLGDVVVTSGLGGSYAKGLIIGTVVKIEGQQGDAARRVIVAPNDKAASLEEVLVVFSTLAKDSADMAHEEGEVS